MTEHATVMQDLHIAMDAERLAQWSAWYRRQARECDRMLLLKGGCVFRADLDAWQPPHGRAFTADEAAAVRRWEPRYV